MSRPRAFHWLAAAPPLAMLAGVPLANRVHGYVLGLPFLLFWILACVLLTSVVLGAIRALDLRADAREASRSRPAGPAPPETPRP